METTVKKTYLGKTYELTFRSDVAEDLSAQNVEERINRVMNRELQRFAEIVAVGLNDRQSEAKRAAVTRSADGKHLVDTTLGRGARSFAVVEEKGPNVTLGAGGKEEFRKIVHDGTEAEQMAKHAVARKAAGLDTDGRPVKGGQTNG